MANHPGILTSSPPPLNTSIIVGNGAPLPVHHMGSSTIPTPSSTLHLCNVLISPHLIKNLISVRAPTRDNLVSVTFDPFCFSKDFRTGTTLLRCDSTGELYPLRIITNKDCSRSSHSFLVPHNSKMWHAHLGHPGHGQLHRILSTFDFQCSRSDIHSCLSCRLGKHVRLSFSDSSNVSLFPFQLLHCDVWTSPIISNFGFKFYLVILDVFSHFTWSFPLCHKSDVLPTLIAFHAFVLTQFQRPIMCLQTDNGKEFDNHASRSFFSAQGIFLRLTCPYTLQQNGRTERTLCTLNDSMCTMLLCPLASGPTP
jgi:hypothetical protein